MADTPIQPGPETQSVQGQTRTAPSKAQRIISISLWVILVLVMVGVIAGRFAPSHAEIPVLYPAPTFALTDQNAQPLGNVQLRGKPYICDFVFTTCGGICPMMSHKMSELQKQTPAGVQLVSFTVNPETDTPPVLKKYAAEYGADESRWHFLTGTPKQMTDTVGGMKLPYEAATPSMAIGHSDKFMLVDGDGNVRAFADSNDPEAMKKLISDAAWLAGTRGGRG
ncbi:MAG: photosynthetic protein synthase [Phycisphaerales bacterium]|jgi:protein SCO1/2|nr:photosynthetic protein synthase [Phycisphaerales bacterium]